MGLFDVASQTLGRGRYAAAQALRTSWYAAHYAALRRRAGGFDRPGEPPFRPQSGPPKLSALRKAFLDLFVQDRLNVEAGLYPPPNDVRLSKLGKTIQSSRAFLKDVPEVERRRTARDGTEVRGSEADDPDRYPPYFRQNFHYQSDGWLSDDSAEIYDTQVEVLFTGAASAMRRAALAEIGRELKGRDQRDASLLEVACGNGSFLAETLRAYPRLNASALDLSPHYAAAAREATKAWPKTDVMEAAAESMPIGDVTQDIVVSIYLFHELPPKIREKVAAEIARVLKPGGVFVFADSLQTGDLDGLDGMLEYFPEGFHEPFYKSYLATDFEALYGDAGLKLERRSLAFLTKVTTWRKPG